MSWFRILISTIAVLIGIVMGLLMGAYSNLSGNSLPTSAFFGLFAGLVPIAAVGAYVFLTSRYLNLTGSRRKPFELALTLALIPATTLIWLGTGSVIATLAVGAMGLVMMIVWITDYYIRK